MPNRSLIEVSAENIWSSLYSLAASICIFLTVQKYIVSMEMRSLSVKKIINVFMLNTILLDWFMVFVL